MFLEGKPAGASAVSDKQSEQHLLRQQGAEIAETLQCYCLN